MYALITGYLFRDPEMKTSKTGTPYVKATIKEVKGADATFVGVTGFRDCADALMTCKDGDAVSVMGELKLRCYEKNGEWRPAADIVANKITALTKPDRKDRTNAEQRPNRQQTTADIIDDDIPF
jgi:single-stranded DNA-binding protein